MYVDILDTQMEFDESLVVESPGEIRKQIAAYERGDRRTFDLNVTIPEGFTGDVMEAMLAIPYGQTRTYGDIASDLATAPIAVGQACGRNPVPLVVPCHRVVGSGGKLTGFSGAEGVRTKRQLLELEGLAVNGKSVQTSLPTEN